MSEQMNHETYTVKDIQQILRIGSVRAYQLIRQPGFPVIRLGRTYRIPKSSFQDWMFRQQCATER